ncbi:MAG: AMP-binding protein, partial [Rhizobiales bacterium]|nr:AMP-binding protein [Hyphomicrobiales bacterium]
MTENIFEQNLDKNPANYQPLTPLSLFARTAAIFPNHVAIIHGESQTTYADFYKRSVKLASAITKSGLKKGETVSVMLSNTPSMLEAHMAVPMTGAVLHTMNTRLDAEIIAFQMDHAETKLLITDLEFSPVIKAALEICKSKPIVIDYVDPEFDIEGQRLSSIEYEDFLSGGDDNFQWKMPDDEWDAISVSYTSGTTGNPKGVVYHHRGATLMCYSNNLAAGLGTHPVYLWTLPMFHCNGWCFPWTISTAAGTHVCLRWVRAKAIYNALADHKVTHMCGAPIVMSTMMSASEEEKRNLEQQVTFVAAAAPPPESVLRAMTEAGFKVVHVYGLTETYGPATMNAWKTEWDDLPLQERAGKMARQGVSYPALEGLTVMDPHTMEVVPNDGETMGEVMFRGNIVMKGYLKNPDATNEAFAGGWFHSGDLGVLYDDDYIQLKDRSKDVIISGGENISSIEVENILFKHERVTAAAVVGMPDEKWGETPCAFV